MNRLKIVFGYLFGFITSIVLVILAILLIFKFTVSEKKYLLKILAENNYYEKVDNEIKEEMSLYILSSGFTDEIYQDVYLYDDLVSDINKYIDSIYIGEVVKLDTSSIKSKITKNIEEFFKKTNETYKESDLESFVDGLVNVYSDEVLLYHFPDDVIKYIPKITKMIDTGIIVSSILLVILLVILIVIRYSYYIATIISSGLIILFIRLFILERIDVNEILIITENFSEELRIILNNISQLLFIVAIFFIILGIVMLVVSLIVKIICQSIKNKRRNIEILWQFLYNYKSEREKSVWKKLILKIFGIITRDIL